jgi:hypothetical protein
VRGAVLHGLSRSGVSDTIVVDSRISRFHYGTLVNKLPFNPVEDDLRDLEYSTYDRAFIAADQTEWFVQIVRAFARSPSFAQVEMLTGYSG